jgi:hypothetical protein
MSPLLLRPRFYCSPLALWTVPITAAEVLHLLMIALDALPLPAPHGGCAAVHQMSADLLTVSIKNLRP